MKKGKVVIISGNKRAGKTTLSIKLHKEYGFNFHNFDSLADSIESVHDNLEGDPYYVKLLEEMVGFALDFAENYGVDSVFEFIDFNPDLLANFKYLDKVEIYYLANLDATIDNIREDMVKYSKPFDWPLTCSQEDIERNVKFILNRNKELSVECQKYGFVLVNTGRGEDREKVLNELAMFIGGNELSKDTSLSN
jgi:deoxyadenosine/deoxycytidine kinase